MKSKQTEHRPKRAYSEPRMRVISLAAEEVLGVGCKVFGGGAAPLGPSCTFNNCAESGS